MANLDGISGIAGDRRFMDAFYLHGKLKKDPSKQYDCFHCYLSALDRCLSKIDTLPEGDDKRDYLDYLRWNRDFIDTELATFDTIPDLAELKPTSEVCKIRIKTVFDNNFRLTEEEKAISNQYCHAYERAKRRPNQNRNVYIHAGKLLINYVNSLKNRRYIYKLDRSNVSFSQLNHEAEYLTTELQNIDNALASEINATIELYEKFRKMDEAAARGQDSVIEKGLMLAHKRASENVLQSAIRHIKETIHLIKTRLKEKVQKALELSSILLDPIRHPLDAIRNLGNAFLHPIETTKAIIEWAKENPWTFGLVVISGVVIGVGVGVATGGVAFAIDLAVPAIALSHVGLGAIVAGVGVASSLVYLGANPASKVVQLKAESQQEIAIEEAKEAALIDENDKEGRRIALDILYDHQMREELRKTRERVEAEIQSRKEAERMAQEARENQVNAMSLEQLRAAESQFQIGGDELETELRETQEDMSRRLRQLEQTQINISKVREGLDAADKLMQAMATNIGLPSEQ